MTTRKLRQSKWFKQVRGSYIPVAWQGWLTYIPYVGFLGASSWMVMHDAVSSVEAIIGVVPYWVSAVAVMTWIAKRKS